MEITVSNCRIQQDDRSRMFAIMVSSRMVYLSFQKIKNTWYGVLLYLRYRIRYNLEIVHLLRKVVVWVTLHTERTDSNGDLNIFNVERDDDERWLNGNNGHPDNEWNGDNRFVFASRKSFYFSPQL